MDRNKVFCLVLFAAVRRWTWRWRSDRSYECVILYAELNTAVRATVEEAVQHSNSMAGRQSRL